MTAFKVNWLKADWAKQDVELAVELGCSRERVRQARLDPSLGNGARPVKFRKRTCATATSRLSLIDTSGMTLAKVASFAGCNKQRASVVLRDLRKDYKYLPRGRASCDWTKFPKDWVSKTDSEIAKVVGASAPAVVAQWRSRHGYRKNGVKS